MTTLRETVLERAVDELVECGFNQSLAAKRLEISRATLRKLVKEFVQNNTEEEATDKSLNSQIISLLTTV